MEIKTIAVLGAGTMGNGIAQVAATSGMQVRLYDIQQSFLDRAKESIEKSLGRMVKKESLSQPEAKAALSRIQLTLNLKEACSVAELVIEAIPEVMEIKKHVFKEVDQYSPPHAILATNTSQLSVTELGSVTKRPEKFIGMHWFNPPPVMKLIEIVVGVQTSPETLEVIKQVSKKMGKVTVTCKDAQGFITTRALTAFLTECYRIYEEGVASAEDIDEAIRLGLNHPMGPMQLTDFIGMDVIVHISHSLVEAYGDRFRLPQSVINRVRAGHHGVKTGQGFYKHQPPKK